VPVLRYFGYLLIILAALALTGTAAFCLFDGLTERFQTEGAVRLVAFDDLAGNQGQNVPLAALIENLDYDRPVLNAWLVFRFSDGWSQGMWSDKSGLCRVTRRGALASGRHRFFVSFPDTYPRLDVRSGGEVWVLPPGARVLWVEAAAIDREPDPFMPPSDQPPTEAMRAALDAVKTLAVGRQVVYLVSAVPQEYPTVRRRLGEAAVAAGPAIWVKPAAEAQRLGLLRRAAPNVDAALLCSPALADAAEKMKITVCRVPRADAPAAEAAEGVKGWLEALGQVSGRRGGGGISGDGK
jgi:hypothetical protein